MPDGEYNVVNVRLKAGLHDTLDAGITTELRVRRERAGWDLDGDGFRICRSVDPRVQRRARRLEKLLGRRQYHFGNWEPILTEGVMGMKGRVFTMVKDLEGLFSLKTGSTGYVG